MKLSIPTATLILSLLAASAAAPTDMDFGSDSTLLSRRQMSDITGAIALLDNYKRDLSLPATELAKRESQIVTDVLTAINSTGLAPLIVKYFVDDKQLTSIATTVIVNVLKAGLINIPALLKSLNDSGLAVLIIQDLINNCEFYAEIYKLVLQQIGNLGSLIEGLLSGKGSFTKREMDELVFAQANSRRAVAEMNANAAINSVSVTVKRDDNSLVTSLMESLKNSGLANSVVNTLVTDDNFYYWGADLISQIYKSGAISFSTLFNGILDSGLIGSIITNFLNIATLKTVIVNALAAAAGKCNALTLTTISATTTITPSSVPQITGTSPPTGTCKKRRRRSYE